MSAPPLPQQLHAGAVLVTIGDGIVVLPPGTPHRTAPCLVCGQAIGGDLAVPAQLIPTQATPCSCGRVMVVAYWAHPQCVPGDAGQLLTLAAGRSRRCHDEGGQ